MKHFLFIIPKTPSKLQDDVRVKLWDLCVSTLISQTYPHWTALVIGENPTENLTDKRFIPLNYEGKKEEKLQKATEFILNNELKGDYLIRLDDDDIINPKILAQIEDLHFDLFVDKYQWFWHYESGKLSNQIWSWFPNTCIHKREHALSIWGDFAAGDFQKFRKNALLIENDHSKLHSYYGKKKVVFSSTDNPVYLRTITSSSITAQRAQNHKSYLGKFGIWRKNRLINYLFLHKYSSGSHLSVPTSNVWQRLIFLYKTMRYKRSYNRNVMKNN